MQAQEALRRDDLVDLELDDRIEELDELAEVLFQQEISAYEPYPEQEADDKQIESYVLKNPRRRVLNQLASYCEFKTKKLAYKRIGAAVEQITADSDCQNLLRFLGYLKSMRADKVALPCLTRLHQIGPEQMESYSEFLIARPITYGSLSNYLNVSYATSVEAELLVDARVCTTC
jgi:hypothetical protein